MKKKSIKGKTSAKKITPKVYGRLVNSDKLLEQEIEFIFEERDHAGNEYDFYLGKITRMPVIKKRATGLFFALPWTDIIKLGAAAGL